MHIKIIETEDGSHSLYDAALKETYHSFHGALQESYYVYIKHGLNYFINSNKAGISILEVGFGTGLNIFLSVVEACYNNSLQLDITSLEPHPLEESILKALNYPEVLSKIPNGPHIDYFKIFSCLHQSPWHETIEVLKGVTFNKLKVEIQEYNPQKSFNLIYFDAFAPSKQPEIWEKEIFNKLFSILEVGGVLVTYCAQGQFKRNLAAAGFKVETLKGPPGKKEMVRGIKL